MSSETEVSLCKLKEEVTLVVKRLGGPLVVSKKFGVSAPAVQQWKVNGLPHARVLHLQDTQPEALEGTRYAMSKAEA